MFTMFLSNPKVDYGISDDITQFGVYFYLLYEKKQYDMNLSF